MRQQVKPALERPRTIVLFLFGLLAALQTAIFPAAPAHAETSGANLCWSENALSYRNGEQNIRKNIAAAIVASPSGETVSLKNAARTSPGAVRRVELPPGSRKLIALTFDLCEQPHEIAGYQGNIVDFLRAENIKATFFAGGKWLLTHPERSQQLMSDPLFEIGNHSWEHRNLRVISGPVLANEIIAPQLAYRKLRVELAAKQCRRPGDTVLAQERTPETIALFRFPYGACDTKSLEAVAAQGLTAIQWDVSAGDPWRGETAPLMTKTVVSHVRPGSIVIFHANGRGWHTSEALPRIVAKLRERGYQFVTVSELLGAGRPVIESRCYDAKPGDTDRYDAIGRRRNISHAKPTGRSDAAGIAWGNSSGAMHSTSKQPAWITQTGPR